MKKIILASGIWLLASNLFAQKDSLEKWCFHFQFTGIMQGHPPFHSAYSGKNSLKDSAEQAFSVTSTIYVGRKLWKGASIYFNPEVAGGKGISYALGIAGFTNGETFRIGDPAPSLYVARIFFRQHFALKNSEPDPAEGKQNQLAGEIIPKSRITITAGKFALVDVFDVNSYSHDPRVQFFNWALMGNGAWDYAANTRGYTSGFIVELVKPSWAIRISSTLVPKVANGSDMDLNIGKARGEMFEFEKDWEVKKRKGAVRILAFRNFSHARNYREAITSFTNGTDSSLNVNSSSKYGGVKYGVMLNAEQELSDNAGIFFRAGWNDGKTSTWAFAEIDQTISGGISLKGKTWKRPDDVVGIAGIINNISNDHIDFLNTGGYGFIIGDGKLSHYASEMIGEIFYSAQLFKTCWLTADYQYVKNPAYNSDRGPVSVWGIRGHIEF